MKFGIILIPMIASLIGCASQQVSSVKNTMNESFKLSFGIDDINKQAVSNPEIMSAVNAAIRTKSKFPFDQQWNGTFYYFSGVYLDNISDGSLSVTYSRGDNMEKSSGGFKYSKYQNATKFKVSTTNSPSENGGVVTVVSVGSDVSISNGTDAVGRQFPPIGTLSDLSGDLNGILANKSNIVIHRYASIIGEVDVSYSPESTYANFLRKLGKFRSEKDNVTANVIEKSTVY